MKPASIVLFLSVVLLWSGSTLWGQANQAAGSTQSGIKIGFVNSLEVLYGTNEGQQKITGVQKFIDEKQSEFDKRQEELQRLRSQIEAQRRTLNMQTLTEMQRTIEEKDRVLRRFQEDTQFEINQRRDEILDSMETRIQQVIAEYARQGGYSAIFLRSEAQVYVDPSLDITADIIRIYNEKYPAPAPSQPPTGGSSQQP